MTLVACWKDTFVRKGYAHFPQLLPAAVLIEAREKIVADLRDNYQADHQAEYDNQSFCPALLGTPSIMKLVSNAAVRDKVRELLDPDAVACDDGQIAIRQAHNSVVHHAPVPHIDGIPTPHNGMEGNEVRPFALLIGVFLSDVRAEFSGNFTVWPGSHTLLEGYFNERGVRARCEGMPQIPLGTPQQLLCKAGDVVLCHYNLAHAAAVNNSDFDRQAVFFRVAHHTLDRDRNKNARDAEWTHLTSIWTDWKVRPQHV